MEPHLEVFPNAEKLAQAAAEAVVSAAATAFRVQGRFFWVLAGGATPKAAYELLSQPPWVDRIDWSVVHVFFGDERCVPPEHPDSNYRMARESLLDHVRIPPENVHRLEGELQPDRAARRYERVLRGYFAGAWPVFDLVLLGMGADGHTASLFPESPLLAESNRWAAAVHVPQLNVWRLTLTPPAINAARRIVFMVAGESKADALQRVLHGTRNPSRYPAQIVEPAGGTVRWLADEPAARWRNA